jgi:hypothetical protein
MPWYRMRTASRRTLLAFCSKWTFPADFPGTFLCALLGSDVMCDAMGVVGHPWVHFPVPV